MIFLTSPGKTYSVNSISGCTISAGGTTLATIPANVQTTFIAPEEEVLVSDNNAIIVEVTGVGAGGSGGTGGSGGSGGPIDLTGVALLEGGNTFTGDQIINGDLTVSGDVTAEGEYNGAEVIETTDTTITLEAGKYYKYTGTEDTITVAAPVWIGYATISYLETAEPVDLQGVTWSPAKPSLTGAGPFVYTLACSEPGMVLASAMNYSVATAEAIKKVVPIDWDETSVTFGEGAINRSTSSVLIGANSSSSTEAYYDVVGVGKGTYVVIESVAVGSGAKGYGRGTAVGHSSTANQFSVAVGRGAAAYLHAISIGAGAIASNNRTLAIGELTSATPDTSMTVGCAFSDTAGSYTCTTEGTGSITIGAGANTKNTTNADGTVSESSNSVTIGCKASNSSFDSIVIGAQASNTHGNSVAIGALAKTKLGDSVAVGKDATASMWRTVTVGQSSTASGVWSSAFGSHATATGQNATALGMGSKATARNATAVGYYATAADVGAMVFRSESADGTYTQLYFSGANTPLANTYEGGEAMMGYVVRDSAGNVMTDAEGNAMVGTQKLSVLFPNNRGENAFTPAMLGLGDEYTPKPMFRPTDLDMPTEEPTIPEPEPYTPLPVYPIVEPEDATTNIPEPEPYTPLPVYPIVEPDIPSEV